MGSLDYFRRPHYGSGRPQLLLESAPEAKAVQFGIDNPSLFYIQFSQGMSLPEQSLSTGVQRKTWMCSIVTQRSIKVTITPRVFD